MWILIHCSALSHLILCNDLTYCHFLCLQFKNGVTGSHRDEVTRSSLQGREVAEPGLQSVLVSAMVHAPFCCGWTNWNKCINEGIMKIFTGEETV